jgi:hypothetical protein
MRLFEFVTDPQLIRLIAATDQLKMALDKGEITQNISVGDLQDFFKQVTDGQLILSREDLYGMIQKKPLKSIISNIQGDEVVFKGIAPATQTPPAPPPEQSKEVVDKMAQNAMK